MPKQDDGDWKEMEGGRLEREREREGLKGRGRERD